MGDLMATALVELAAQLVSSHASNTAMSSDELLSEISKVYAALKKLEAGQSIEGGEETKSPITLKEAFKKNEIVCMICGRGGFKTLARHLSTTHGIKPSAYKKQFGIPAGQALSSKSYSETRRQMAKDRGLADNLALAREVRMANIDARKSGAAAKPGKIAKPEKATAAPTAPKPPKNPNTKAPKAPKTPNPKAPKVPKAAPAAPAASAKAKKAKAAVKVKK
jgi:predicted transcriptional regulator